MNLLFVGRTSRAQFVVAALGTVALTILILYLETLTSGPPVPPPRVPKPFDADTKTIFTNSVKMPVLGYGTAGLQAHPTAILSAAQLGYRLFDTASDTGPWYKSEKRVGEMLVEMKRQGVERREFFITTKLHPQDFGEKATLASFASSLQRLGTDYVDLYLLHYPRCWSDLCDREAEGTWQESWKVLQQLLKEGKVRSIGLANFRLEELKEAVSLFKPHLVQTWIDPLNQPWEYIEYCRQRDIQVQAYSPLGTQHRKTPNPVLTNPTVVSLAEFKARTPAQVVLRWLLSEHISVIPRASSADHQRENLALLDFTINESERFIMRNLAE